MSSSLRRLVVLAAAGFVLFGTTAAYAHENRDVGAITMRVGWLNEPTYSGSVNAVQVFLHKGGGAITDGKLSAVVLFGPKTSTTKSQTITLDPSDDTPGEYDGAFIPSRPGTYTFHITGTAGGQKIDQFFTSSDTTFDNVKDPTLDEFPAKDPTNGQLAQRMDQQDKTTSAARGMTVVAIALAVVGIVLAIVALARRRS